MLFSLKPRSMQGCHLMTKLCSLTVYRQIFRSTVACAVTVLMTVVLLSRLLSASVSARQKLPLRLRSQAKNKTFVASSSFLSKEKHQ